MTEPIWDAFLSYSHKYDRVFAAKLQSALESFAKPFLANRSMRVFRDDASLPMTSALWSAIVEALDSSSSFLLLASPNSAKSDWVHREVEHFLTKRTDGLMRFGIVLTGGVAPWVDGGEEMLSSEEAAISKAVYRLLIEAKDEPLVIDLRPFRAANGGLAKSDESLSAIASVAAAVTGQDKDAIYGKHLKQQRQTIWTLSLLVAGLLIAGLAAGWFAYQEQQRREDLSASLVETQHTLYALQLSNVDDLWEREPGLATEKLLDENVIPQELREFAWRLLYSLADREVLSLEGSSPITGLSFSSTGQWLASRSGRDTIQYWDLREGREVVDVAERERSERTFWDQAGRRVHAFPELQAGNTDPKLPELDEKLEKAVMAGLHEYPTTFVFSPDSSLLATGTLVGDLRSQENNLQLWNVMERRKIANLHGTRSGIFSLAFSSDGTQLASGDGDRAVLIWDVDEAALRSRLTGHRDSVTAVTFSPDGHYVASGDADGQIKVRSTNPDQETWAVSWSELTPTSLSFYLGNEVMLVGTYHGLQVLELGGGSKAPFCEDCMIQELAVARTGVVAIADFSDVLRVWDPSDGRLLFEEEYHLLSDVAFLSHGAQLAATVDREVVVLGVNDGREVLRLKGHDGHVGSIAISDNGASLVSADGGTVRMWSLENGESLGSMNQSGVQEIVWIAGRNAVALIGDNWFRIWDWDDMAEAAVTQVETNITCATATSDGKTLATGHADGRVRLWDPMTGLQLATVQVSRGQKAEDGVSAVAFSSGDTAMAASTYSGLTVVVGLWNSASDRIGSDANVGSKTATSDNTSRTGSEADR